MLKKLKGWKTFIVSILTVAFGAIASYDYTLMTDDPALLGYIATGIGVLNFILRMFTNTPPLKKE